MMDELTRKSSSHLIRVRCTIQLADSNIYTDANRINIDILYKSIYILLKKGS